MKTLKNLSILMAGLFMAFATVSCDKDDDNNEDPIPDDPLAEYQLLGEQTLHHDGLMAKLYMMESPFVGYNTVAVRVMDGDNVADNMELQFRPMMDMGTMMHTTPVEQPMYDEELEAYLGAASFIMPSGTAGTWSFQLIGGPAETTPDTAHFDIAVMQKEEKRLYSFISNVDSSTSYFVALREPMSPEVGLNDFELMVYRRESMMSFPAATDLKVEIEPEMPTMNHGSPNNEHPQHMEGALYSGSVNFTMSGYWKVHVKVMNQDDELMNEGAFDITFE